jgi:RimJ/RimL family protein N-acetyltransferase
MIVTERLTLRAPAAADAPRVTNIMQDVEVTSWLTNPPYPYALSDAETFIAMDHGGSVHFIHDGDGLCGCISLDGELGYWLARDRWGRGYMSEAAGAVVVQHFETSDADLDSGHFVGNARSRGVLMGLGFVDGDIDQHYCPTLDATLDNQKMVLTRAAWESRS